MFVVSAANLTFFCSNFLFLLCFFSTLYVFFLQSGSLCRRIFDNQILTVKGGDAYI